MNSIDERKVIQGIPCQKSVDNSTMVLKGFWEQSQVYEQDTREMSDVMEIIISIVEDATESIYIYSPDITHTDLRLALEKKRTDGIRIYAITSSIKIHSDNKLFSGIGIMREMKDISSTFVISDPKGSTPRGIWFIGNLTSKQESVPFFLTLNEDQVKEAWAYFSNDYWKAHGEELYFDTIRETKELKPAAPEVKEVLPYSFRVSGIDSVFGYDEVNELWLSPNMPQELSVYCSDAKKIVLQVHDNSKNIIESIEENDCKICGTKLLPFCFAHVGMREILMSSDMGFILTDDQKDNLNTAFQMWQWQYQPEGLIQDINRPIILSESDWTTLEKHEVQEVKDIKLEDVIAPSFEDWQNERPESEIPDSKHLAKRTCYRWTLKPPTLPEDARRHKLYGQWDRFSDKLNAELSELKKEMNTFHTKLDENKSLSNIIVKQKLSTIEGSLLQIEKEVEPTINTGTATDIVETFMSIKQDFLDLISKDGTSQEGEENELEVQKKNKSKSKKKQKNRNKNSKNELEATRKPDDSKNTTLSELIPRKPIPPIGTLYERGNTSYLTIQYVDQIDEGSVIAKQYHATLVAEQR